MGVFLLESLSPSLGEPGLGFTFFFFLQHWVFVAEKAMAPHSSTLAWKIPWMEERGGLQSMGSLRVGHD